MMEIIVQWATILSPIIAVVLAWWMSRSGARDTAKLVKSIKKLSQIQIHITRLNLFKEYQDAYTHSNVLFEKSQKLHNNTFYSHLPDAMRQLEDRKEDVNTDHDYYQKRMDDISKLTNLLDDMDEAIKRM